MKKLSILSGNHVVILGAGISGLSLAWFLRKKWGDKIRLSIVEKDSRPGGWIQTDKSTGFLFEMGPRSFRTKGTGADTLKLIKELGLKEQVITANSKALQRYLYVDKHLQRINLNPFSYALSGAFPGLIRELFAAKGETDDESIASFFRRRTNSFIVNQLVDPMVTGIYAGDIEQLSIRSCFPKLWNYEKKYGSILKGMWKSSKSQPKDPWIKEMQKHPLFTLKDGAATLTNALAVQLKEFLWLNTKVESIRPEGEKLLVVGPKITFRADAVFSTLPAHALTGLTESPYLENLVRCIPTNNVALLNMGYRRKVNELEGFGYLVPSNQKDPTLGVVWDSSIFPQQNTYDPETRLTVMMGGSHHPEIANLPPDRILQLALLSLSKHMDILFKPDACRLTMAKQAIPQYRIGHHILLREIEKAVEAFSPRLKLLGASFYGVAVNDCIANAEEQV